VSFAFAWARARRTRRYIPLAFTALGAVAIALGLLLGIDALVRTAPLQR
jgi:hypothetical protein